MNVSGTPDSAHWVTRNAKRIFLNALEGLPHGLLSINGPGWAEEFGDPGAALRCQIEVHDEQFFLRALLSGDTGVGESYMDGDWSSPDVISVLRLAYRNAPYLRRKNRAYSLFRLWRDALQQHLHANTIAGSQRNIHAHYDLGNDFFRLFLDQNMVYSCGFYRDANDSLETAQTEKLDRICRKLRLQPQDHVLEIGTGWGAFAFHAARNYGCRVTTTTISREQFQFVRGMLADAGELNERIELLFQDYRTLQGQFDKIVSIEMFEAVGYEFYDDFFDVCNKLLQPNGAMLIQIITIQDQVFSAYRRRADWIQKYIFPGSQLASLSGILESLARSTQMSLYNFEDMGAHYARTLEEWRTRFHAQLSRVRDMGFDDRFIRMWDFYLATCAAGFHERYISDAQLLITKNFNRASLMAEPWAGEERTSAGMHRFPSSRAS